MRSARLLPFPALLAFGLAGAGVSPAQTSANFLQRAFGSANFLPTDSAIEPKIVKRMF